MNQENLSPTTYKHGTDSPQQDDASPNEDANRSQYHTGPVKHESMEMETNASRISLRDYYRNIKTCSFRWENTVNDYLECEASDPAPLVHVGHLGTKNRGAARVFAAKSTIKDNGFADTVAEKLLKIPSEEAKRDAEQEIKHLKMLRHNHIVAYLGHFTKGQQLGIIMFPVAAWDLDSFLEHNFEPPRYQASMRMMRPWFVCLTKVLLYLHDRADPLKHRDIKPKNILIDRSEAVFLIDFGISKSYVSQHHAISRGDGRCTILYGSAAIIERREHGLEVDVFALGCVFLEMITVMLKKSLKQMEQFILERNGKDHIEYSYDLEHVIAWADELEKELLSSDSEKPLVEKGIPIIKRMLNECSGQIGPYEGSSVALLKCVLRVMDEIYPSSCESCNAQPVWCIISLSGIILIIC
jgi:serine/threonine protein kinase